MLRPSLRQPLHDDGLRRLRTRLPARHDLPERPLRRALSGAVPGRRLLRRRSALLPERMLSERAGMLYRRVLPRGTGLLRRPGLLSEHHRVLRKRRKRALHLARLQLLRRCLARHLRMPA